LNIKLADFGFSRSDNIESLNSIAGTENYIAPEIRALAKTQGGPAKAYDGRKADLFSVGVILFLLVKGTYPFLNADEEDFYYSKIIAGDADTYFGWVDKEQTLSSEFKDLVWRLLSPVSGDRPSLEDIRKHSWLKNKIPSNDGEEIKSECVKCVSVIKDVDTSDDQSEDAKSSTEASTAAEESADLSDCGPSDGVDSKIDEVTEVRTSFEDSTSDLAPHENEEAKSQCELKL